MILRLLLPGPVWPLCHPAAYLTSGCLTAESPEEARRDEGIPRFLLSLGHSLNPSFLFAFFPPSFSPSFLSPSALPAPSYFLR